MRKLDKRWTIRLGSLALTAALLRLGDLLANRGRESPEDEELPAF